MSKVFVVDANKQPLNPVHPGYARLLLKQGKAAVLRRYPFVLILHAEVEMPPLEPLRVKLDPGSKTTGLALVNAATGEVIFAAEILHRGLRSNRPLMVDGASVGGEGSALPDTAKQGFSIADDQRAGSRPRWKVGCAMSLPG